MMQLLWKVKMMNSMAMQHNHHAAGCTTEIESDGNEVKERDQLDKGEL